MEYTIFCDESTGEGQFFSSFYGGVILKKEDYAECEMELLNKKVEMGLLGEVKWTNTTLENVGRYKELIDRYFDLIDKGWIHVRILFRQNCNVPPSTYKGNGYCKIYYQLIKHHFGFQYCNADKEIIITLNFDKLPVSIPDKCRFKAFLMQLEQAGELRKNGHNIKIKDITEWNSKNSTIMQGLDIILGAMCFKLNSHDKLRTVQDNGKKVIGKRTKAKLQLYKHIYNRVCQTLNRKFNPGISTGIKDLEERWSSPYLHWNFVPKNSSYDGSRNKRAL